MGRSGRVQRGRLKEKESEKEKNEKRTKRKVKNKGIRKNCGCYVL